VIRRQRQQAETQFCSACHPPDPHSRNREDFARLSVAMKLV